MPFKRRGRPHYYIGPLTAAGIHIPRMSTGVKNKKTAQDMEAMLRALPARGYGDLVEQVIQDSLKLDELHAAYLAEDNDKALAMLRLRQSDQLLTKIVGEPEQTRISNNGDGTRERQLEEPASGLHAVLEDDRMKSGLKQLIALAPANARLSWLRDPKNVTALYERAISGEDRGGRKRKPNSVRRSLHRAVSELLAREVGRGQMLTIMADVRVPGENDERTVLLSPDEIVAVLQAADPEFQAVIGLAVTTGIDRGASLQTLVRDYDETIGILNVNDTKTPDRKRPLNLRDEPLLENAEFWLRKLTAHRDSDEPLVALTEREIRDRWEALREKIARPDVRWKDLRGIFATYYLRAGGDIRDLQHILGHAGMTMTMRYLRRLPVGKRERLKAAAKRVGRLDDGHDVAAASHPRQNEKSMPHDSHERMLRVTRMAVSVFVDPVKAARWMSKPCRALKGKEPAALAAESEDGARAVEEELARIEHGIHV